MQTKTVSIHDAKTNLSKYIASAKKGSQIFIGGFGKPEVKLVPITPADISQSKTRDFSIAKNKITEHEDSFSEETENQTAELALGIKTT